MKLSSGLMKFSSTSAYGNLPTVSQITSFWSRFKAMKTAMNTKQTMTSNELDNIPEESVLDEWVGAALTGDGSDEAATSAANTGRGEKEAASTHHRNKPKQVLASGPALTTKSGPLAKSSLLAASSLASNSTATLDNNNTATTGSFNIPKPGLHGAMNATFLADKTFVIAGQFPEVGGGDPAAPGVTNIKIMIESFGGKANTGFSKKIELPPRRKRFSTKEVQSIRGAGSCCCYIVQIATTFDGPDIVGGIRKYASCDECRCSGKYVSACWYVASKCNCST